MKRLLPILCLLLGTCWSGAGRAAPVAADRIAPVLTAALEFIAPRTLEPVTMPQLSAWGLRGLTALDPALTTEVQDGMLRLLSGPQELAREPAPADGLSVSWARAVASLAVRAAVVSESVRRAGAEGVIRSFFEELFNHLDPYSRYVAPDPAGQDRARRDGEAGIGVTLARRGRNIVVVSVVPGGPAAAAGVRAGDRLLEIDDEQTTGQDLDEVQDWLQGPEGSGVTLLVRGRSGTRTLELERAVFLADTVFTEQRGDLVLIRMSSFARNTDQLLATALDGVMAKRAKPAGIVIDLRGNRGGLLRQAVATASLLVRSGQIVLTAGRNPQASHDYTASGEDVLDGRPVVVLVDGRSASAAEIFAAALADQRRAVVVGSSTLGKGLVQTIANLPDGGELFVTWSRVLAPGGWPIQGLGVLPQVCTSTGQDSLRRQLGVLRSGRLELRAALQRHHAARAPLPAAEAVELRNACPAAEGRDLDLEAARALLASPNSYQAALLGPYRLVP